ncbi:LysR family transcriptional regulator [Methylophaga sp. OBS4]|uniref:LysR family transcriptional regulator n=1 Tax=Methylophaga sp. OBS4 TaxID=2991935 RepID=UPI00224D2826|nr:LysR family transcriptional regulator [Methylophaga sp. OBS4]MCX4188313.1 LysR substrate-binding domain-containing protein [Methylophaga sp. OBS4]
MDTLRGIESFVRAVELGSITAAARRLEISPAAASQNIARLESELGARLLTRTTRSLALTDSGEIYYQRVKGLVQELELAKQAVSAAYGEVRGKLCIACSAAFARHVLAPLIPAFNRRYPQVSIELIATDRRVDHIQEGVDVSIRIRQQLEDGLVARRIAVVPLLFCAAPGYLQQAGRPDTLEALRKHDCLMFKIPVDGYIFPWVFQHDGRQIEPEVRATMISDDIDMLARMAIAGGGITRLAAFVAEPYLAGGQLEQLFYREHEPGIMAEPEPLDFYFCVADRYARTPKVAAFFDYLNENLPHRWR